MKHLLLYCALFLLSSAVTAQSKKELSASLASALQTYQRVTLKPDLDSTLGFMPPKMFDIVPRDSMLAMMTSAMDNENMRLEMTGIHYKGTPKIKKAGQYHWALVSYDGDMLIHLKGGESFNGIMMTMMKGQFGKDNVQAVDAKTIKVLMQDKQMIVFKDPASTGWSFIEDKRKSGGQMQAALYESVVPEEVRKAVDKKKK